MSKYIPYPGTYPGARAVSSKAPVGWSAATQTRQFEDVHLAPVQVKREAVADRAADESADSGGGGARLPFMIQNMYLAPGKTGSGAVYTQTRMQPKDVEKPAWAK
mmetsp:Transcript_97824/g.174251  ORF Transcript_97824/g.174251 Transcript_97824/m.174251 type:complete len:105 (-) Transcript_97824:58-372(-)|eukprot:CAMPEP_0197622396 /NCGR_PEP_ID=MMETSP1338-20131121/2731_1 /TAXON_ID=43686 ORGANISM="Pelagodinium beii, Strain RCC1491" /NCGR_SAMPLE_ID=MMETSP1338 /ASSEMBLY_ACC=CAM_ASM_000754 /LENGTH=104 /DNA_ID=CAMNT_0043192129 /DNA_START=108 /DNA_END=422 /DNA_ORIENTATION=-